MVGQHGGHLLGEGLRSPEPAATRQLVEDVEPAARASAARTTGSVSAGRFQSAAT